MNDALMRLLGEVPMLIFSGCLVISAMSTLDSTLSSSAKLIASDMGVLRMSLRNGRSVMAVFMLLGLLLVFWGNKDLFSAVAVSGTASMYLAPVIFFSLWGRRSDIPLWSYLFSVPDEVLEEATDSVVAAGGVAFDAAAAADSNRSVILRTTFDWACKPMIESPR